MARMGASLKTKRAEVPSFWKISKKKKRFVVRTSPGPHSKKASYPLLVLIRDLLSLAKTRKEALSILNAGKVRVDGRIVKAEGFPIGLMDIVDIPHADKTYRMVPLRGGLVPVEVDSKEKDLKLCLVKNKTTIRSSKMRCGLHDGRVIFPEAEVDIRPGDSCLIRVPKQEFIGSFRIGKGTLALLVEGERSGEISTVEDLKPGTFSRGAIATVRLQDGSLSELPTTMLMPLGKQLPELTVSKTGMP